MAFKYPPNPFAPLFGVAHATADHKAIKITIGHLSTSRDAVIMSYSPIGDTIALTKLAYTLYSRVIVVARDAPGQFEALLRDLDAYKNVLYRIRNRVDHDSDPSCSDAVVGILDRCFHTLYGLRDLTTKYENLGVYSSSTCPSIPWQF